MLDTQLDSADLVVEDDDATGLEPSGLSELDQVRSQMKAWGFEKKEDRVSGEEHLLEWFSSSAPLVKQFYVRLRAQVTLGVTTLLIETPPWVKKDKLESSFNALFISDALEKLLGIFNSLRDSQSSPFVLEEEC